MKYFFDNCISYRFANMLAALGVDATPLRDAFPESTQDADFLAALTKQDVYITYDHRQRTREAESRAIVEAGVTALWIGPFWRNKLYWDQAKWLISRWEKIDHFASSVVPGTCAELRENGRAHVFRLK